MFRLLVVALHRVHSPFQLCKIKTIYCKWIGRGLQIDMLCKVLKLYNSKCFCDRSICNYVDVQFGNKLSIYNTCPTLINPSNHTLHTQPPTSHHSNQLPHCHSILLSSYPSPLSAHPPATGRSHATGAPPTTRLSPHI